MAVAKWCAQHWELTMHSNPESRTTPYEWSEHRQSSNGPSFIKLIQPLRLYWTTPQTIVMVTQIQPQRDSPRLWLLFNAYLLVFLLIKSTYALRIIFNICKKEENEITHNPIIQRKLPLIVRCIFFHAHKNLCILYLKHAFSLNSILYFYAIRFCPKPWVCVMPLYNGEFTYFSWASSSLPSFQCFCECHFVATDSLWEKVLQKVCANFPTTNQEYECPFL